MLRPMTLLLDSFWRALAYLLMPRVIGLSLLPLLIAGGLTIGWAYWFWDGAYAAVRQALEDWALVDAALKWVESMMGPHFRAMVVSLILIALAAPLVIVASLLLVALLMTPAIVSLVAERRFPALEKRRGAAWWQSLGWSLGATVLALLAIFVTLPLWLIPGAVLIVPPLIWGWLTARVMAFDALAEHASADERRALLAEHRWQLLLLGIVSGFLGAAPTLIWAVSALALVLAPLMVAATVWLYTLVFAFSSLWFTHYLLAALHARRAAAVVVVEPVDPPPPATDGALVSRVDLRGPLA